MLKEGDVIFISDKVEKNISGLSMGFGGFSYYHCALYIGFGQIIEAVTVAGVIQSSLSKYHDKKILIGRAKESSIFLAKVVSKAKEFIGFSYNNLFLPDIKNKLYCSELIHEAFKKVSGRDFFRQHKLNYISPYDLSVSQYWINFYESYGLKVPQGQIGSHPNNLSLDDRFEERFFLNKS